MPKDNEPRGDAADVYLHALNRCIELAAAASAERMLLPGDPERSVSDVEHTIQYASLVCRSPESAAKFISFVEAMADDLLRPYGHVIIALGVVLKIRRTLTGEGIDDMLAGFELAAERRRRPFGRTALCRPGTLLQNMVMQMTRRRHMVFKIRFCDCEPPDG